MVKGYNAQEADRYFTEPPESTQVAGSGHAKIILTCDIEYKGKKVFENTGVYFYGTVWVDADGSLDNWDSEEIISRKGDRLVLDEWVGTKEVENFMVDEPYSAFTLIIKHVDYDDLDFEPEEENY